MVLELFYVMLILSCIHNLAFAQDENTRIAPFGCNSTCGNVEIPFPFGMNEPNYCYADHWFQIECRHDTPYLKSIGLEVSSIDVSSGTIDIMHPIHRWNCKPQHNATNTEQEVVDLRGSPFVYSQAHNMFVSVGCNEISFLVSNGTQVSGCVSICDDKKDVEENIEIQNCNGKYCCVTSLPLYLLEFNVTTESFGNNNNNRASDDDECSSFAWIVSYYRVPDYMRYDRSYYGWNSMIDFRSMSKIRVVLEWEIHNSSIRLPRSGHCVNTNITSAKNNHSGRRCYCLEDSYGNPYIEGGCSYANDYGDNGEGNKNRSKWAIIGIFSSVGSIIFLLGSWRVYKAVRRRKVQNRIEKNFKKNGGLLLEKRMSSGEVNIDKVKHFTLREVKATL